MASSELGLIIGIIGNVTSVMVYASPIPTFWYIYKKKSTEYFSALPYVCTLLTVLMGLFYGCIKENGMLIITINIIGLVFETAYLIIFLKYAAKFSRIRTLKQVLLDFVFFGLSILLTLLFARGKTRVLIVGSLCSAVAISMYAAPLSIMRLVVRTKNVDFMPVTLSAFLVLNGSLWSAYSFFVKDIFIGIPSVLGSMLSFVQVMIYLCYKNAKRIEQEEKPAKQAIELTNGNSENSAHKIDIKDASDVVEQEPKPPSTPKQTTGKVADLSQEQKALESSISERTEENNV